MKVGVFDETFIQCTYLLVKYKVESLIEPSCVAKKHREIAFTY